MVRGAGAGDGGGEEPDTADLAQVTNIVTVLGELMYLALDVLDFGLELNDFIDHDGKGGSEGAWEVAIAEDSSRLTFGIGGSLGDGVAELAPEPAKAVDAPIAGGFPLFAAAVQLLELLLVDGTNRDGFDAFTAVGFEQCLGVDEV